MKDYASGKPAEEFYKHIVAPVDFPGKPVEDLRGNHIEGDFAVGKMRKYVVEVKGENVCFRGTRPSGNLPIEIKNTANPDGNGWFIHCQVDNVGEIVFVCCILRHPAAAVAVCNGHRAEAERPDCGV